MTEMQLTREIRAILSSVPAIARIDNEMDTFYELMKELREQRRHEEKKLYRTCPEYRELYDRRAILVEQSRNQRMKSGSSFMSISKRRLYIEEFGKITPVESKDESTACTICTEFEKCIFFGPCGHKAVCSVCAIRIIKDKLPCPMCRKKIGTAQQVFD
jgi:hypothetical protein